MSMLKRAKAICMVIGYRFSLRVLMMHSIIPCPFFFPREISLIRIICNVSATFITSLISHFDNDYISMKIVRPSRRPSTVFFSNIYADDVINIRTRFIENSHRLSASNHYSSHARILNGCFIKILISLDIFL